jgi:dephospho-CoA kinase
MIIIGLTGTIGAGKGTMVDYLKKQGYIHYSARSFLLREVAKRNLEPNRDNILLVANGLRKEHFPGYIIAELLKEAQSNGAHAVIESIRSLGEIDTLKKLTDRFYLVAVDADPKVRYERIKKRNLSTDHVTFEKFLEDERKETVTTEPWAANLKACIDQADFVFKNDGTFAELETQVEEVLHNIHAQKTT